MSPETLQNLSSDILEKALDFYQNGGKLFIIQHSPEQDLIAQTVLSSLFTRIRRRGKRVKLFLPEVDYYFSEELFLTEFLLIHNLPRFREILAWLAESNQEQIIIATGTMRQWERMSLDLPLYYYQSIPSGKTNWRESLADDIKNELEIYERLGESEKLIFGRVLALDSLGIPIPVDLLANSLNLEVKEVIDITTEIEEKGLLACLENEQHADLLVCSNSPQIARRLIEKLPLAVGWLENALIDVIEAVNGENKDERYTILNLFQSALSDSSGKKILSRPVLRNLTRAGAKKLEEIWSAGDETEHLLWGKVLEELQLFEPSAKVFAQGLGKNKNNEYLRQAKARMVGRWSLIEPSKLKLAEELFAELTSETAENPFFLQARGVFESAKNNPRAARDYFKSAWQVAAGEENKAYILTAWANLEIEQANFEVAEEKLSQIRRASTSAYLPHLRAKLNYYRGDYLQALANLKKVFEIRPMSLVGWNLLGEMASERAHWRKAGQALETAFGINPENIPTLRALGDLETDLGKLALAEENNSQKAGMHFERAKKHFEDLLAVEPENFYGTVSESVLRRYQGKLLKRKGETEQAGQVFQTIVQNLKKLYQKYPFNEFVTHNLGETYLAEGDYKAAGNFFAKTGTVAGLIGMAKTEIALGKSEEAVEYLYLAEKKLTETRRKQHERIRVLNSLAEVWGELNRLEKAIDLCQESLASDAENGFTLLAYARLLEQAGERAKAESLRRKAENLAAEEWEDFSREI